MRFLLLMCIAVVSFASSGANAANKYKTNGFNTIDMTLRSYHINKRCYSKCTKQYNEKNYGVGITISASNNIAFSLGMLENSFYQRSLYAVVNVATPLRLQNGISIVPGISLGGASGYEDTPSKNTYKETGYVPVVSPNISLYTNTLHFNLGILPSANTAVAIFRAGVRF